MSVLYLETTSHILQAIKSEQEDQLIIIREKLRVCHHLSTTTPPHVSHYIVCDAIILFSVGVAKFLFFGE